MGNEACVEGAIAAGVRFFAGYPITPASEIAEIMAARLPQVGGCFIQMEDELGSITAATGASSGGKESDDCFERAGPFAKTGRDRLRRHHGSSGRDH